MRKAAMILDQFNLSGKTALVTGASRGLGEGMALALAQAGADIVGVARSENNPLITRIKELGRQVTWIQADLSRREESHNLIQAAEDSGIAKQNWRSDRRIAA